MIKLAASNFARWFICVRCRKSHIVGNFAPPEAQNRTNRPARVAHALAHSSSALATRRISMCGYTVVLEDGPTCKDYSTIYTNF